MVYLSWLFFTFSENVVVKWSSVEWSLTTHSIHMDSQLLSYPKIIKNNQKSLKCPHNSDNAVVHITKNAT